MINIFSLLLEMIFPIWILMQFIKYNKRNGIVPAMNFFIKGIVFPMSARSPLGRPGLRKRIRIDTDRAE